MINNSSTTYGSIHPGRRRIGGSHRPVAPQFSAGSVATLRARGPVFAWPAD